MKHKIYQIIYFLMYHTGIIRYFYWKNRKRQRILVFHHIIPDEYKNGSFEQDTVCTFRSRFEKLTGIINRRFKVTTEPGEPGTAMITFDDGYRAALVADEVLASYSNKGVFFVPPTVVDGGPLWVDRLMAWFAYVPEGDYTIGGKPFHAGSKKSRQLRFSEVMNTLYEPGGYHPDDLLAETESQVSFNSLPIPEEYKNLRFKGFSSDEILKMQERGHKIGGHSVRHDVLSLLSPEELKKDFKICSEKIGTLYNIPMYAYPYGHPRDVTEDVVDECKNSGFRYGVMNEIVPMESDHKLSRLNISRYNDRYEVEAALSGLTEWLKRILK